MNLYAIVCLVLESDDIIPEDIILTAYQSTAMLKIIDNLPSIEKHALEDITFNNTPSANSISGLAIQHLREDDTFVAIASLGSMSITDLINILTALSTGNEDDFGYWEHISEDTAEDNKSTQNEAEKELIERFLNAEFGYGRPYRPIGKNTKRIDFKNGEGDSSYIALHNLRGTGRDVWLPGHIYCPLNRAGITTNYELLMYFAGLIKPENEPQRIGKHSRNVIQWYFEYWLGCDDVCDFANQLKESGFQSKK